MYPLFLFVIDCFFYDEFSKYEYTIDDTCNKRFPEQDTKPF